MGLGLFKLITYLFRGKQALTLSLVFLIFGIEQTYYSEKNYYQEPNTALEIGYYINKHTDKNDLIIINYDYIDAKCPIYLYASRRNGWQLNSYKLSGSIIDKLILEKASYFFSIRSEPPVDELKNYLSSYPLELQKLSNGKVLYMYDLKVPARDQLLLKKDV